MSILFSVDAMVNSLIGGAIMGATASFLLLFNGRIMGVCGIAHGIFYFEKDNVLWRIFFIVALAAGGYFLTVGPDLGLWSNATFTAFNPASLAPVNQLMLAGLLVGFGTSLGRGCTTGHGVCGLSRFGASSLVATMMFMFAAGVTVYVTHHLI